MNMTLSFLDRKQEAARIRRALETGGGKLVVVYGRRRCGKSRLIQELAGPHDVYYLADQGEAGLQRASLATEAARAIPDADGLPYPTWQALLAQLERLAARRLTVFLDEFPYLVEQSPDLPSVIQRQLDLPGAKHITYVLSGSSQRMMHGLTMDAASPLYGRAAEIVKVEPLRAGWILDAFRCSAEAGVEAYAVWGGVPRYWELALPFKTLEAAVKDAILDRNGVLHDEPMRLLMDDLRSAVQPFSILTTIGDGCRRISEIAGRLQKPLSNLSRPLSQLMELGYVRRELPWGESEKTTRRSLYSIADPFMDFHFRFVRPARSQLSAGMVDEVWKTIAAAFPIYVGTVWEQMARESVPQLELGGLRWKPASRWWGPGTDRAPIEIDVVAESVDGSAVLVGEAKWSRKVDVARVAGELLARAARLPFLRSRKVVAALWVRTATGQAPAGVEIVDSKRALDALRI